MSNSIDVWLSIGSTYSYLTVMRIEALAARQGVDLCWRPFNVCQLMVEQNNIPFRDKPTKAAYMWRDIARRAAGYGLEPKLPVPYYPLTHWDLVNRIAVVAAHAGWCGSYLTETYRRWFELGEEPGGEATLSETLHACGQDQMAVLTSATSDEIGVAYRAATDEARGLGIFGAPTFVVRRELFWGDDRLDDAMQWATAGRLTLA